MTIDTLIDKVDNVELVRDQIAAILLLESKSQQAFADSMPAKDPKDWALRVFVERTNPFDEWTRSTDGDPIDTSPAINVSVDSGTYDPSRSNVVERQLLNATYNVDCYGYGIASGTSSGGQIPGDTAAALEAHRAYRLVRNILMAGTYTYLGLQGIVARRWSQGFTTFTPDSKVNTTDNIVAVRFAFQVDLHEFSPQVTGVVLETLSAQVTRMDNGQLLAQTDFTAS
jgi:hypothetical protein